MTSTIDITQHIVSNPNVMFGKPVLRGTRIPVHLILEKLAHGETKQDLLRAYPTLSPDSIAACLLYAANIVKNEMVYLNAA